MGLPAQPIVGLIDVNNFYVSAERAFNPRLASRPVVVLSNNDGCVVARSQEVKQLGVKMSEPFFKLKDLARQHGIIALSSNYTLYADMSNRVMTILRSFSPNVEVYSIDEAFLGLDGMGRLWSSPTAMGIAIREQISRWTSLPVCAGFGETKVLAKLANHFAKTRALFNGVCDLSTMSDARKRWLCERTAVDEIWGVGKRIGAQLEAMGIRTVQDLMDVAPSVMRARFGVVMERVSLELRGIPCLGLEEVAPPRKQIVSSKAFGAPVEDVLELEQAVSTYVTRAAEKLRAQHSACGAVHVFVHTNPFKPELPQYGNGQTVPLVVPSADTRHLAGAAIAGLHRIYRPGYSYKKAGVMLLDLHADCVGQGDLFVPSAPAADIDAGRVMATLDALNARFGRDTVQLAAAGLTPRWAMRAGSRTPRYTTSWSELPIARAG